MTSSSQSTSSWRRSQPSEKPGNNVAMHQSVQDQEAQGQVARKRGRGQTPTRPSIAWTCLWCVRLAKLYLLLLLHSPGLTKQAAQYSAGPQGDHCMYRWGDQIYLWQQYEEEDGIYQCEFRNGWWQIDVVFYFAFFITPSTILPVNNLSFCSFPPPSSLWSSSLSCLTGR